MNTSFYLFASSCAGQWRASPARMLVAIIAIAIGVGLALAIHLVNRSALDEFKAAIAVVNGNAQLQLQARAGSFDEQWYSKAARAPGVAAASPMIETEVRAKPADRAGAPSLALTVIGLDVMRAASVTPSLLPIVEPDDQKPRS
ncbi:MAG: hypothetical protein VW257_09385, partial [Quisquiliibacterium sp.]